VARRAVITNALWGPVTDVLPVSIASSGMMTHAVQTTPWDSAGRGQSSASLEGGHQCVAVTASRMAVPVLRYKAVSRLPAMDRVQRHQARIFCVAVLNAFRARKLSIASSPRVPCAVPAISWDRAGRGRSSASLEGGHQCVAVTASRMAVPVLRHKAVSRLPPKASVHRDEIRCQTPTSFSRMCSEYSSAVCRCRRAKG
jgi:hypothetical protein